MPWKRLKPLDQRLEFVILASQKIRPFSHLCREFGISRPTGYQWLNRYLKEHNFDDLKERSRRPKHSPDQTDFDIEQRVVSLRKQWGWGAKKLDILLRQKNVELSIATINRIIKRNGLVRTEDTPKRHTKRFEHTKPNSLWQMDFKGYYPLFDGRKYCHPLTILDDHSRYLISLTPCLNIGEKGAWSSVVRAFEKHGVPDRILFDHGSPWWSAASFRGLTRFSVGLLKQGVKLKYSGIMHPQTQGKVERFHRTLNAELRHRGKPGTLSGFEWSLKEIRHDYNHIRPHEALAMQTPGTRYERSPKAYNPTPKDWEYPEQTQVVRVNDKGLMCYGNNIYKIGNPFIGEKIGIRKASQRTLILFRDLLLAEIDPKSRLAIPISELKECKGCLETKSKA